MDFYVSSHLFVSTLAIPLGVWILSRRKGDRLHKALGRTWAGIILLACLTSLGIRDDDGSFNAIHLLTLWTFVCLVIALSAIKIRQLVLAADKNTAQIPSVLQAVFRPFGGTPSAGFFLNRHRNFMIGSCIGLVVAGGLAIFTPGRFLYDLLIVPIFTLLN